MPTLADTYVQFDSPHSQLNSLLDSGSKPSNTAVLISDQLSQLNVNDVELRGGKWLAGANICHERRWLISSPYLGTDHQLDLLSLDLPNTLMALALQALSPASETYATQPYLEAFKWIQVMEILRSLVESSGLRWSRREFYVVEFRSQLKPQIDRDHLWKLDEMSHAEAVKSGGLLKYWYGTPNHERRNLATCLWRSKEDATIGGRGPWHKQARAVIPDMYEQISVKGLQLVIEDNVSAWHLE